MILNISFEPFHGIIFEMNSTHYEPLVWVNLLSCKVLPDFEELALEAFSIESGEILLLACNALSGNAPMILNILYRPLHGLVFEMASTHLDPWAWLNLLVYKISSDFEEPVLKASSTEMEGNPFWFWAFPGHHSLRNHFSIPKTLCRGQKW